MRLFKTDETQYLFSSKKNKEKLIESKKSVDMMEKNNLIEKPKQMDEATKRKLITFGVLGVFILGFLIFAIVDFNGEEKKSDEFELPETTEDKIGSKSEGFGTDTINRGRVVDLNNIYNTEEEKKDTTLTELQKKVLAAARDNENKKEISPIEKKAEASRPVKKVETVVYETKKTAPVKKEIVEPYVADNNTSSGFFKKKKTTSGQITSGDLSIYACIHTNQTIMNGQRVKFRTTKEFTFNGKSYPTNTIVYGTAQIQPNRLMIKINKINQTDMELEVYDSEDSEKGLYVLTPNLNASLKKEVQREGIQDDDLRKIPFSKSLKRIFERKVKEEKVELLNNYKVIIKLYQDE